jgi:glycosyltransferase involved in cell wall biosynthesis
MASREKKIRVGFLSPCDPLDPTGFSGTPYSAWKALEAAGLELVDLGGRNSRKQKYETGSPAQYAPSFLGQLKKSLRQKKNLVEQLIRTPWDYSRVVNHAEKISKKTQAVVDENEVDILFCICVSSMLYDLETDIPIVYASDTTADLINKSYPKFIHRSRAYKRACEHIDRIALQKCTVFAPCSNRTAISAIGFYELDDEKVRVVEFGAHVLPDDTRIHVDAPSKEHIELVVVAADPIRKRLDLCMEVADELHRRGWMVTLNYIGPKVPEASRNPRVEWHGRLQLNDSDDRKKHCEILMRSHWMLLPSLAEAFGIAPCEAAHFGRPSVVTDVGGLSTVIKNGVTGSVLPIEAPASRYADAIELYSNEEADYMTMSDAALVRAKQCLNWESWASRMNNIFVEVIEGENECPQQKQRSSWSHESDTAESYLA